MLLGWVVGSRGLASRFRPLSHVSGCYRPMLRIYIDRWIVGKDDVNRWMSGGIEVARPSF